MIPSPFPGWHITSIDQSIAVARYNMGNPNLHAGAPGVSIQARASGSRYDRWMDLARVDDPAAENYTAFVTARGFTYEDAFQDLCDQIVTIEQEQPL